MARTIQTDDAMTTNDQQHQIMTVPGTRSAPHGEVAVSPAEIVTASKCGVVALASFGASAVVIVLMRFIGIASGDSLDLGAFGAAHLIVFINMLGWTSFAGAILGSGDRRGSRDLSEGEPGDGRTGGPTDGSPLGSTPAPVSGARGGRSDDRVISTFQFIILKTVALGLAFLWIGIRGFSGAAYLAGSMMVQITGLAVAIRAPKPH